MYKERLDTSLHCKNPMYKSFVHPLAFWLHTHIIQSTIHFPSFYVQKKFAAYPTIGQSTPLAIWFLTHMIQSIIHLPYLYIQNVHVDILSNHWTIDTVGNRLSYKYDTITLHLPFYEYKKFTVFTILSNCWTIDTAGNLVSYTYDKIYCTPYIFI